MGARRRISVVVNTVDRAASLALTLDALASLDHPAFEVVVVNGPSTDETEALLETYSGAIKVGRCDHRNLSESRNVGIALAAGEIVAFIDDDAYPDPAWLDRIEAGFDGDDVAAVGGPTYDHTGKTFQARYNSSTWYGDARAGLELADPTAMLNLPDGAAFGYTIGTNAAFRRDLLVELGGFDEEFEYYLDETDVCARLVERGLVVRFVDDAFVYHKFLPSSIRTPKRAIKDRRSVIKNTIYFALVHGLRRGGFAELCAAIAAFVEHHRRDLAWNVEAGLLEAEDVERFEADLVTAGDAGFRRGLDGVRRTRPPEFFAGGTPFLVFPTRRPSDGPPLHVCLLSQEYPPGPVHGIGRYVHELATGLAAEGHVVRVLTRGEGHSRVDREDGVWVHRPVLAEHSPADGVPAPEPAWSWSATMLDEVRRMAAHRPVDAVIAPNWDSEGAATIASGEFTTVVSLLTPLATVVRLDPRIDGDDPKITALLALERWCYERADHLLANGRTAVAEIEAEYDVDLDPARTVVVPLGLPDPGPVPVRPRGEGVDVLFVGRLEARKGIDTLRDALPRLLGQHPRCRVVVVGRDGPADPDAGTTWGDELRATGARLHAASRVVVTGPVDDAELARWYAAASVFVAPSRFESFGLTVVEAMAAGLPVVAVDTPAARELVADAVTGVLVAPDDPAALADAIGALVASPERRAAMGTAGRARFDERFRADRMVTGVAAFLRDLTGARAAAPAPPSPTPTRRRPPAPRSLPPAPALPPVPVARPADDLLGLLRCPRCGGPLVVHADVRTEEGRLKTGELDCARCAIVAADVRGFHLDFHVVGTRAARTTASAGVTVPALGERRVGARDAEVSYVGAWHDVAAEMRYTDGPAGAAAELTVACTDASVRLLRHPHGGIADLFVDDEHVGEVDLYLEAGSGVIAVSLVEDAPFGVRRLQVRGRGTSAAGAAAAQVHVEEWVLLGPRSQDGRFGDPTAINRGNAWSPALLPWLDTVPAGSPVLEVGGGDRRLARPGYVNFEYLPYELADVYGDIHALPFRDDAFDLVFSQAVFEHVRNPFDAARELLRVTRPGGIVATEVAFLQPLHAVPYHFFNMTNWGLEELFSECEILESSWDGGRLSEHFRWVLEAANAPARVGAAVVDDIVARVRPLESRLTHDDLRAVTSGVWVIARKAGRS